MIHQKYQVIILEATFYCTTLLHWILALQAGLRAKAFPFQHLSLETHQVPEAELGGGPSASKAGSDLRKKKTAFSLDIFLARSETLAGDRQGERFHL